MPDPGESFAPAREPRGNAPAVCQTACVNCGYSALGLPNAGSCPECGEIRELPPASGQWVAALRSGLRTIWICLLLALITYVGSRFLQDGLSDYNSQEVAAKARTWMFFVLFLIMLPAMSGMARAVASEQARRFRWINNAVLIILLCLATRAAHWALSNLEWLVGQWPDIFVHVWRCAGLLILWIWFGLLMRVLAAACSQLGLRSLGEKVRWWSWKYGVTLILLLVACRAAPMFYVDYVLPSGLPPWDSSAAKQVPELERHRALSAWASRASLLQHFLITAGAAAGILTALTCRLRLGALLEPPTAGTTHRPPTSPMG